MKKHFKFMLRSIAFICLLCICIKVVYQIIMPKLFYQEMLPTTLAYTDFYDIEENTIDVLFLGSSLAATSYIPQELYDGYGITGYNLSSEKQSPIISYFWLKEALRYQHPKALVLDLYYFYDHGDNLLNTQEAYIRRALDYMKWSPVKREAVRTVCKIDESQSALSYYFPNIRYHTRWMELTEEDFLNSDIYEDYALMGYAPLTSCFGVDGFGPYDDEVMEKETDLKPLMKEYLDKIVELCNQEGISLILTSTPVTNADKDRFYLMQEYADEHGLLYLDFNEKTLYDSIGFDFYSDSHDSLHQNLWGAKKITNHIGHVLTDQYNIGGKFDEQWEDSRKVYEEVKKDCELQRITDINEYIPALDVDRYSVFISTQGSYLACLNEETILKLRELGLEMNLQTDPSKESYYCYFAVLSDGRTEEYIGYDERTHSSSIRNSEITYDITGTGSIIIDGVEESVQKNGLKIVVYNNKTRKVMDSVCLNASIETNTMIR